MASLNITAQNVDSQARDKALKLAQQLNVTLHGFPTGKAPMLAVIERAGEKQCDVYYSESQSPQGMCHIAARSTGKGPSSSNANANGPFNAREVSEQVAFLFTRHYMNLRVGTPGHITNPQETVANADGTVTLRLHNGQAFTISVTAVKPVTVTEVSPLLAKTANAK